MLAGKRYQGAFDPPVDLQMRHDESAGVRAVVFDFAVDAKFKFDDLAVDIYPIKITVDDPGKFNYGVGLHYK